MIARILYAAVALVLLGTVPRDAFRSAAGSSASAAPEAPALASAQMTASALPASCPPAR